MQAFFLGMFTQWWRWWWWQWREQMVLGVVFTQVQTGLTRKCCWGLSPAFPTSLCSLRAVLGWSPEGALHMPVGSVCQWVPPAGCKASPGPCLLTGARLVWASCGKGSDKLWLQGSESIGSCQSDANTALESHRQSVYPGQASLHHSCPHLCVHSHIVGLAPSPRNQA